jgi:hypothetical protein
MKYALLCSLSISILFICITAEAKADATSDSIYTLKHVLKVHIATPDSALSLLNTMEAKKLEKLCLINAQRGNDPLFIRITYTLFSHNMKM